MCDERERLIGFLYDEVDAIERRHIEAHLEGCPECRAEIAGLQNTRQDLLAWDVPTHEPVWRPVVPERPRPSAWQQVPAWAMAAAATAVLASGLTGALAVRWFSPVPAAPAVAAAKTAPPVSTPVAASSVDVAAIEARVLNQVREEMRRELMATTSRVATTPAPANAAATGRDAAFATLMRRIGDLERRQADQDEWRNRQISLNALFDDAIIGVRSSNRQLGNELVRVSMSGNGDFRR
jgi:hypothetical protein